MRVGIYFPGFSQESGGGFTFEHEIFAAVNKLAGLSNHEFLIMLENTSFPISLDILPRNLKIVSIKNALSSSVIHHIIKKVIEKIGIMSYARYFESPFEKWIRDEKIQLVWYPTPNGIPLDVPYITTVWDIQHRIQPWYPEVSAAGEWNRREELYSTLLRRAVYIITPNMAGTHELSNAYGILGERFRQLPHPAPEVGLAPTKGEIEAVLRKYHLPVHYLFYPAQFWPHKNHANLLYALKLLKDEHKIIQNLVLVGSEQGNLKYIQDLALKLGLKDQVYFLGFIPKDELISLYHNALALVFVSLFGPENLPPLEAFACRCPVIAAEVPGAFEQYGEAALLVNGLDVAEIANAIKRIVNEPGLCQELIRKGLLCAQKFSSLDFIKGVFDIFDEFELVRRNWE